MSAYRDVGLSAVRRTRVRAEVMLIRVNPWVMGCSENAVRKALAADGPPVYARPPGGRHRSAVEQIFQDGSCAAGAFLATEIDVRRHARPAVPKLVCGISRRQSSLTHQSGHALSECVTAESRKARTSERRPQGPACVASITNGA